MSQVPAFGKLPRKHTVHTGAEEQAERALRRVEDENRQFYEESQEVARNISMLQLGVQDEVGRLISQGVVGPMGENATLTRLKEEKIQSSLYRAVQGNEIYDTQNGEDSRNYEGSVNAEHLAKGRGRRKIAQMKRVGQGLKAMLGGSNFVENQVNERFGKNKNVEARRVFVANRMRPFLEQLFHNSPQSLNDLYQVVGLTPNPPNLQNQIGDFCRVMSEAQVSQLRRWREWCLTQGIPLYADEAFRDLLLLANVEQENTVESGLDAVNDHQELRRFWNSLRIGPSATTESEAVTNEITNLLEANSLFPLENSVDGKGLLAELRVRMQTTPAADVLADLQRIRNLEAPTIPLTPAQSQVIDSCKAECAPLIAETLALATKINKLSGTIRQVDVEIQTSQTAQTQEKANLVTLKNSRRTGWESQRNHLVNTIIPDLEAQIANEQNNLINAPHQGAANQIQKRIDNVRRQRDARLLEVTKLEQQLFDLNLNDLNSTRLAKLDAEIATYKQTKAETQAELQTTIEKVRENGQKIAGILNTAEVLGHVNSQVYPNFNNNNPATIFELIINAPDLAVHHQAVFDGLLALSRTVNSDLPSLLQKREKMTPFVLLQRWMRLDYMRSEGLELNLYNEEANHYANLKAALRIEDIKSIDRKRTANAKAAELLNKGLAGRGFDKLKLAVAKGQDLVGLEPFNIKGQTADRLVEQIINSRPEFAVFKGINKFSTVRDLRDILNRTGQEVKMETIEKFAETLEEAVSKYKKIPPTLEKGLNPEDWDLENTVTVLKKLRIEMWSRKSLEKVEKSGANDREKALISLLKGARQEDQKISAEIRAEVKDPDAIWRKYLVKDELKAMLDKEGLEAWNKIKTSGIEFKRKRIGKLETEINALADGSPKKDKLSKDMENLKAEIDVQERQIDEAKDLYERVDEARTYIRENKLSRKEKREYLKEMGLTQVYDKMSTNFRMQRAWHYSKKGAAGMWKGTKQVWNWSRRKFLNTDTAKKGFSLGRMAATPLTWPIGKAWKFGTWPIRLTGRALKRSTQMPKRFLGIFSKKMLRSYLRDRAIEIETKIVRISEKQAKLLVKMPNVPYGWDRNRLQKKINALEEQKLDLREDLEDYRRTATEQKINIGALAIDSDTSKDKLLLDKAA